MKNWKEVTDKNDRKKGSRVYVHEKSGDIKVVYPKAPKWAQRVALAIYQDIQDCGDVTEKGVKDIVRGSWAYMIAKASK